jgi:hypothetical protein
MDGKAWSPCCGPACESSKIGTRVFRQMAYSLFSTPTSIWSKSMS